MPVICAINKMIRSSIVGEKSNYLLERTIATDSDMLSMLFKVSTKNSSRRLPPSQKCRQIQLLITFNQRIHLR